MKHTFTAKNTSPLVVTPSMLGAMLLLFAPWMSTACSYSETVMDADTAEVSVAEEDLAADDEKGWALGSQSDHDDRAGRGQVDEEEFVPIDEATEFQDANGHAWITKIHGMAPRLVPGSLKLGESKNGDGEAGGLHDALASNPVNNFTKSLVLEGSFDYSSGFGGTSFDTVVGDWCPGGSIRESFATSNTGFGYCVGIDWYSEDPKDCRFSVHVGMSNSWKSGTCNWKAYKMMTGGYFDFNASFTNNALQGTTDVPVWLQTGQTITVGTCGVPNAYASGDTYLRVLGLSGQTVSENDDACGSVSSNLGFTVPPGGAGTYTIKAGCFSSSSCSGRVSWVIE